MKFNQILFRTPMVQAILAGRKTMTRRIVKPQPIIDNAGERVFDGNNKRSPFDIHNWLEPFVDIFSRWLPGDVLWVRESFAQIVQFGNDGDPVLKPSFPFVYKADGDEPYVLKNRGGWKPSIHMPKAACRLFLKVKSIKVERLNDISEQDAIAEGIISQCLKLLPKACTINYEKLTSAFATRYKVYTVKNGWTDNPIGSFSSLWEKINGLESLKANPWVWVIEFERIEKPENFK